MVEIFDLALRAVIDSFEIYTINSLIKKNCETSFIMPKALFEAELPKQNKNTIIIMKESSGSRKSCFQ